MRSLRRRVALVASLAVMGTLILGWWIVYSRPAAPMLSDIFTTDERAWLGAHPLLRLAPDPNFPPIEYFDDSGRYSGLIADYYALIEPILGVRFEVVQAENWDQVLTMAQRRDVDLVGAAQQTTERDAYLNFSQPIVDIPNVIIVSKSVEGDFSFPTLAGKRLAVTRSNALHEFVDKNFPDIHIVPVEDDLAGLRDVAFGRVDATVVNLAIASYLIQKHGIANLRVAGDSGRSNALHIATRNDWPMLNSILSKALASISDTARAEIQHRWIHLDGNWLSRGTLLVIFAAATAAAVLVLSILLINRSLRRQVEARTAALNLQLAERRLAEEKAQFLAYHDALTHLPNRILVQDRFTQAAGLAEHAGTHIALLFVDLDNFKTINDSLGHATGDAVLKEIATRLVDCTRDTDTISRQGGDEFLILLTQIQDSDAVVPILQKLMQRLIEPVKVEENEFIITASIGLAFYPEDGRRFDILQKKADMALYRAKDAGRNTYCFFDEAMNIEAMEHLATRNGLRRALDQNELVLHYQPQIDLESGKIIGAEALIRWQHPENGLLLPGRFIAIAEESRLIIPMGEWVLREACRQAVAWRNAGLSPFMVAVNLSAMQLHSGDLVQRVVRVLEESGHDPAFLELELTESILLNHVENVMDTIVQLKQLGVKLSIDDFGTGYSSLSYLKRFDIDKLKIDQSFIRDITTDPDDSAIVRAIIQMGHSLNLKIIAEGVEDAGMLEQLRLLNCDEAQGYYFAKPMAADALTQFIKNFEHT